MKGIAYSSIPPSQLLTTLLGEFKVVHSNKYCYDKSCSVKPAIIKMLSYNAAVVKAQQLPQRPWSLTADTFCSFLQSTWSGAAESLDLKRTCG